MRLIPFLLYLVLIAMFIAIFEDLTAIVYAKINLAAFAVLAVALYKGELAALWFGLFAGLVAGAIIPHAIGWYALFGAVLGVATFHMKDRLNLDSLAARLLLTFCGVLVFNLAILIVTQPEAFGHLWLVAGVAGASYTTGAAAIFFMVKHGVLTGQKIKSIF